MDHVKSVENSAGREAVEEFWEKAVESKCEGLMIKVRVRIPHSVKTHQIEIYIFGSFLTTQKSTVRSIREQMQPQRTPVRTLINMYVHPRHGGKRTSTDHTRRVG